MFKTLNVINHDDKLLNKLTSHSDRHNYATRNRNYLELPRCSMEKSRNCIHYTGVKIWNDLPNDIKSVKSVGCCKFKLKCFCLIHDFCR